ncbi:hypothetical protein [Methanoregula sp. PtaB.Bin085]|uniref:hypothetical protein n=1 Tax=Methanoregula sp. PtaB.Bin085 TaxID=1811680 RepID=UPI0025D84764|nr:hypothetical protein [Methanoregula sp. PtaB.Bin085]
MKWILLFALGLACIAGPVSAYGLYIDCPATVQVGLPLKCSIDSNLPAGNTFDLVLYRSQYTATELSRQSVTIQEDHVTQYRLFETRGLPGGTYKIEVQDLKRGEEGLSSDSVTFKLVTVLDRSDDITITSPVTQDLEDALRIEGSITKLGGEGVEIEVRGPEGKIFGPQFIGTKEQIKDGSGEFTYRVAVTNPGTYEVSFKDTKGFIGIKKFTVKAPPTPEPTTVPTTIPTTTVPPTTLPTPLPTTQSPLSPLAVIGAIGIAGLVVAEGMKRR